MLCNQLGSFTLALINQHKNGRKTEKKESSEFDDMLHYQKIIVALSETDKLMNEIHNIDIEREKAMGRTFSITKKVEISYFFEINAVSKTCTACLMYS
jgi:hypothetical protein